MRVASLALENFRSIVRLERMQLGAMNVLVGANNSGKSSILRALYLLQSGSQSSIYADVRVGSEGARAVFELEDVGGAFASSAGVLMHFNQVSIVVQVSSIDRRNGSLTLTTLGGGAHDGTQVQQLPAMEPRHLIVPYLAKRRTLAYEENVSNNAALLVSPSLANLAAKLSRLSNPSFPGHDQYMRTCKEVLGFVVTSIPADSGQRPGIYLPSRETIPIDQMGEGVPNIVGLLADLALSEKKLFLMEEPENDLHPRALKALLDLVVESSKKNQFVVSTHSNIVLRHLGSIENSCVYTVNVTPNTWPQEATVQSVEPTATARMRVLQDLGYAFSDFDLWDGWLLLEESSAERIIREYLIPWFAPKLVRLRTVAARGTSEVEPMFEDFRRLVLFAHLEKAYKSFTWVRVDGDESGAQVVRRLKERYPSWDANRFACFSEPRFENFYPATFSSDVAEVFKLIDKKARQLAKGELLDKVRAWLDEDENRARAALMDSAATVIAELRAIEKLLPS